ncbi:MAG: flagellin, partial [Phycisphaerae bacterium]
VKGANAVVSVGGQQVTADGLTVSFNVSNISGEFNITTAGNAAGSLGTITINGGGATFQLGTSSSTRATIGINALFSHDLGDSSVGILNTIKSGNANSLTSNANNALSVVRRAISQVATEQGRIGGFQKFTVDSTMNSLGATKKALTDARGLIRDTDYALETANLSRIQVLTQSAIALLGVAGQQTSQILTLLQ